MKKTAFLFFAAAVLVLDGCNSGNDKAGAKKFPKPGTVVTEASMPVNDPLNHFTFSVKVIADSNIRSGVYDVDADFGPNYALGQFTMPAGIEDVKPLIRKGDGYTYIIGFKQAGDTTFYEYFEVSSNKQTTEMRYLKSYTF